MNAASIIDEIKNLPQREQERVVEFVHELERRLQWSGDKLSDYEKRMVETTDPAEAKRLKEQIVAGFFGREPDA
jgi:hypothetical protein